VNKLREVAGGVWDRPDPSIRRTAEQVPWE